MTRIDDAIAELRRSVADLLNYESEDTTSPIDSLARRYCPMRCFLKKALCFRFGERDRRSSA